MLFNSFEFLIFFAVVTSLYYLLPHKFRWFLLLTASCYFYSYFKWYYIFILVFTIVIDYYAGIWISLYEGKKRKWALVLSIIANVGVLALFKYYYFIIDNANVLSERFMHQTLSPLWHFALPIGLSFHTFQAMSYTIEVYRGNQKVERNFGIYALYVMFYPQLVAGPIERPQNILHQFYENHEFNYNNVVLGLRLMLWGMFKKVVIANNLSVFVDRVYGPGYHDFFGYPLIIATLFYTFQIYCDFSGYSDIAIGAARVMGFNLMKNFNRPYAAKSISEFWSRWHISLSTWFRDYLYIPLGGNRVSNFRRNLNLFAVFLVSGLWHGASWNFIIWGAIHGFYLICGNASDKFQNTINQIIGNKTISNFLHNILTFALVAGAWIFFRASDIKQVKYIIKRSFAMPSHPLSRIVEIIGPIELTTILISLLILYVVEKYHSQKNINVFLNSISSWQRYALYYCVVFSILIFGYFGNAQFIYFQF